MPPAIECETCGFARRTKTDDPKDEELGKLMAAYSSHSLINLRLAIKKIQEASINSNAMEVNPDRETEKPCPINSMRIYVKIPDHLKNAQVVK